MATPVDSVHLEAWTGPWPDDDKDANLKADVALDRKSTRLNSSHT